MSDAARDSALEVFDPLIGTWDTEATHPKFDGVVAGSTTFERPEGGRFIVQRSQNDDESFPDAIAVIGAHEAGDGLRYGVLQLARSAPDVRVSLEEGVLRFLRDHPGFDQRFSATLEPNFFEALWQLAERPGESHDDLKVAFSRRD